MIKDQVLQLLCILCLNRVSKFSELLLYSIASIYYLQQWQSGKHYYILSTDGETGLRGPHKLDVLSYPSPNQSKSFWVRKSQWTELPHGKIGILAHGFKFSFRNSIVLDIIATQWHCLCISFRGMEGLHYTSQFKSLTGPCTLFKQWGRSRSDITSWWKHSITKAGREPSLPQHVLILMGYTEVSCV